MTGQITARNYKNSDDLGTIQVATAQWINMAGFTGYLHIDDIAMRLFNGMRRYDPREIVRLWQDKQDDVLGWAMLYPAWNSYEVLLHPDYRDSALAVDVLDWAERETLNILLHEGHPEVGLKLDVFDDDRSRIRLLEQRGYQRDDLRGVIGARSLEEPLVMSLPAGFAARRVEGVHEITHLIDVMNAAFDWHWTAEEYIQVVQSPGYHAHNHVVIIEPDGTFSAFCYLMLDTVNKLGMIENVGVHPQHRRKGLGRALLVAAMNLLQVEGMERVLIPYHASLMPAAALYESIGLRPEYRLYTFTLPRSS